MTFEQTLAKTLRAAAAGALPDCPPPLAVTLRGSDATALAQLATAHRMAPWLAAVAARDPELGGMPAFEPVRAAGMAQMMQTLRLFGELSQVLKRLNEMEVPVIVLKGPAVAEAFYPDPGLRPYGDIDLLIHETDLARVGALLQSRGYYDKNEGSGGERVHACHGLFQRIFIHPQTRQIVEVHCDHLQIGVEPISMDAIWRTAPEMRFGAGRARILEQHDLFVHLCVHLNRHGFERLIWFKDLDLMVRTATLDWAAIRRRARQEGCAASVAYTLWLLEAVLGTPLPVAAAALAQEQAWMSRRLFRALWPQANVVGLVPQRLWRFRRAMQFAPETGILRGGLPSLLINGRRRDKLRILGAAAHGHSARA